MERKKGNSVLQLPSDYTIVDLETTGLNPKYDNIIEVACVKYRDHTQVAQFSTLVQPPLVMCDTETDNPKYVNDFIASLTGITNNMLSTAPKFEEIANDLWNFLENEFLVGHNISFDINFLYDNFETHTRKLLQNDFLDTLRLSRRTLPDLSHHRLIDLMGFFDIGGCQHRALGDCYITNTLLVNLKHYIVENHIDIQPQMSHIKIDLRAIKGNPQSHMPDHSFFKKYCVFTGKLETFTRKEAAQIVANIGGYCENGITKKTNFLIVGNFDYCSTVQGNKSSKIKKAERLILNGQDLQIITEQVFCDLISETF